MYLLRLVCLGNAYDDDLHGKLPIYAGVPTTVPSAGTRRRSRRGAQPLTTSHPGIRVASRIACISSSTSAALFWVNAPSVKNGPDRCLVRGACAAKARGGARKAFRYQGDATRVTEAKK